MGPDILVVGQTPPPFGGQAMMIQRLVTAKFQHVRIHHVRMGFSDSFKSVGSFGISKLLHLPSLIFKVWRMKFQSGATVLYYPPSGPNLNPLLRDLIILFFIRPLFKKTIFHFRAAGVSEYVERSNWLLKAAARWIYGRPDAAIQLSVLNPPDGNYFQCRKLLIIRNGLEDAATPYLPIVRTSARTVNILFVGVINKTKGIFDIVEACRILTQWGVDFRFVCLGEFASNELAMEVKQKSSLGGIDEKLFFPGVKTGSEKWKEFLAADMLCFPTFFESESFGNVVVEAMMFELPVVATNWRGVPDIVDDGSTGMLVPINSPDKLAESIRQLAADPDLRLRMGKKGREKFLRDYQLHVHLESMEHVFTEVAKS